ncbi:MFS transporter [Thermoactinomyces sp. CICC 10522]|jgi:MFS transporter, ACS family, D-galactonate transporter|uniref:MFS transporter n=1 Tax=Thermoactinomyces sp. CICC 10522 TaxID=2767427 RepID=UPI0018DD3C4E|nr:MFS transporter [Thermoactinomyces sp. CICC 10522]MBH8603262.1 MFS transporter [Thermoactinomyces sp. CICC 10522]
MKLNRRQIWTLFLIFSGTLINAIDRSSLATANTFIAKELHLSMGTMGLILSAFGWAYLFFNIPAGWFADRFGAKKVYGITAAIWSIASAVTGLARGAPLLFASRILVGLGEAANFPAATKIVAENFKPSDRSTATGIYLSGLRLGYALTPGIMIGLMVYFGTKEQPDWRMAFYITGLGSLLWVILWFATFREKKTIPAGNEVTPSNKITSFQLLKHRNTWAIIIIKFFQDYLYYLYLTWLPGFLIEARKLDLDAVTFYATLPWVAGMLAQPLIGVLADYLIKKGYNLTIVKKTLLITTQVIALSVIGAAYAKDAETAAWLLIIAMAAESASTAILWTLPQELAPEGAAGTLGGIMNTAGAFASIVSPAITGFIAQYYGFTAALTFGGSTMLMASLSVLFFLTKIQPIRISTAKTKTKKTT